MRRLRSLLTFPTEKLMLFSEAWVLAGLARIAILIVPFRRIAPFLGSCVTAKPTAESATPPEASFGRLQKQIAWSVRLVDRLAPWETKCFVQAITARVMLGIRGLGGELYLGMLKEDSGEIKAHAWLMSGGVPLTGGDGSLHYTILSRFTFGEMPFDQPSKTLTAQNTREKLP